LASRKLDKAVTLACSHNASASKQEAAKAPSQRTSLLGSRKSPNIPSTMVVRTHLIDISTAAWRPTSPDTKLGTLPNDQILAMLFVMVMESEGFLSLLEVLSNAIF